MTTIAEDFRTFVLDSPDIATLVGQRMHQHRIPDESRSTFPHVWYRKSPHSDTPELDGTTGVLLETTFDVEVLTDDPDELDTLTDLMRTRLNGYPPANGQPGAFGSRPVRGVFAEDHDEDYVPFNLSDDEGTLVSSFQVLVIHAPLGD